MVLPVVEPSIWLILLLTSVKTSLEQDYLPNSSTILIADPSVAFHCNN